MIITANETEADIVEKTAYGPEVYSYGTTAGKTSRAVTHRTKLYVSMCCKLFVKHNTRHTCLTEGLTTPRQLPQFRKEPDTQRLQ